MRITICWNEVTGYMSACWRALASRPDVSIKVIVFAPRAGLHQAFSEDLLKGIDHTFLRDGERENDAMIFDLVRAHRPDVVVLPGWLHRPYNKLAGRRELSGARFIMTMDNPWKETFRQRLAWLKIRKFLNQLDAAFVAGERSWQFARRLGMPENRIFRGVYGFDSPLFEPVYEKRVAAGEWPHRFLFVGRYVTEKGFDILIPAYRKYRESVSNPWPLTFCGQGPMQSEIADTPGTTDIGFTQPSDLPNILQQHGVFIMASRQEHWCVALAEAMAAGLPAIATEEVGASIDLVRSCYNGMIVPTADVNGLADAMRWMHNHPHLLPEMGRRAREFASAHSAELWADRMLRMIDVINGHEGQVHPPARESLDLDSSLANPFDVTSLSSPANNRDVDSSHFMLGKT